MRSITKSTLALTTAFLGFAGIAAAQAPVRLVVQQDSKLWIDGGSNLHSWTCKAATVDGTIDADPAIGKAGSPMLPKLLQRVQVKIAVASLKCGEKKMDANLYKALKADDQPTISYILGSFESVPGAAADSFMLKTVGKLTIAGVERSVTMDVSAIRLANGSIRAQGSLPIQMTEFGIKPPTALLGTLRTKDKVTVNFDLVVSQRTIAAATADR
jgi:polyisoprenoid-binding protein YceI